MAESSGAPAEHNPRQSVGWDLDHSRQETVDERISMEVRRVQGKSVVGDGEGVPVGTTNDLGF